MMVSASGIWRTPFDSPSMLAVEVLSKKKNGTAARAAAINGRSAPHVPTPK